MSANINKFFNRMGITAEDCAVSVAPPCRVHIHQKYGLSADIREAMEKAGVVRLVDGSFKNKKDLLPTDVIMD